MSAVAVVALLSGCATVAEKYEAQRREEAKAYASKGEYLKAYRVIQSDLASYGQGAKRAVEIFNENPQFKSALPEIIRSEMRDASDPDRFVQLVKNLDYDTFSSVLSQGDRLALRKEANEVAADGNRSNRLQWLLTDAVDQFSSLGQPDQQRIIYNRSLALLRKQGAPGSRTKPYNLAQRVFERAEAAGSHSDEFKALQAELPNLEFSTQDLKTIVAKLFPQYASKEIAGREITVKIAFDDRLIEEDAMPKLRQLSPNLTFIKNGQAAVNVSVKKLQWDERASPQQTQTVTYSQTDVNLLAAALLMPRNASYIYEVSSGGVQLSYAFEVKATSKGAPAFDELVRDRASREWRSCSNARIQNVFGGVQRADFVANDHMQTVCGNGGSPSSPDALRSEAISRLVTAIGRIPGIAKASGSTSSFSGGPATGKVSYASVGAFVAGDRVRHPTFGTGTVYAVTSTDAHVIFDGRQKPTPVGMETLSKL
ncbi:hypothetical protein FZ983_30450 [Azospirillum sp. B21]|uniref:hypothetical protein n=1 Tax=Azospirillum sp. B21 TaxID=2607496 RepID=UPI0011EE9A71|nr:hypothetical protein [Azospirillum sp. B21]KAA0573336.1 hypothetical protein FZ983_30450 [Azospirillum sp. B21]